MAVNRIRGGRVVRKPLPITECSGCSACCQYQGRPPVDGIPANLPFALQIELMSMDSEVEDGTRKRPGGKLAAIQAGRREFNQDLIDPCWWLDPATNRCRHYEHRPQTCRDFKMGGEACLKTRTEFRIPLPMAKS